MKKFIKHLVAFLLFVALINLIFSYFYEKPIRLAIIEKKHQKYLKYSDIHNKAFNYDLMFLGSSRGYHAYSPLIFDSILATKSYNMCTGSQNTIESYYILKEILLHQNPKFIIYELFLPSFNEKNDYYHILSNAKFFNSLSLKGGMIINGFGVEGLLNYLIPITRHKVYIKNDISSLLIGQRKLSTENAYLSNNWISGYYLDERVVDSISISKFGELYSFENTIVSEKKVKYFNKIVDLCNKNGIELICVRAPYPPQRVKNSRPRDEASLYFDTLCFENRIKYYDFNNIIDPNFKYVDTDFADANHMNSNGAEKVSRQLAEIIKQLNMSFKDVKNSGS